MLLPRRAALVLATQGTVTVLVAGWFATGHSAAPDSGLRQLDALTLHEQVPGIASLQGLPTMLLAASTCPGQARLVLRDHGRPGGIPRRFAVGVLTDPAAVQALHLGRSLTGCRPGYALVDPTGLVRYRTYDPGLGTHSDEQRVLLERLG